MSSISSRTGGSAAATAPTRIAGYNQQKVLREFNRCFKKCESDFDRFHQAINDTTRLKNSSDQIFKTLNDCGMEPVVSRFEETLLCLEGPSLERPFYWDMMAWLEAKKVLLHKLDVFYPKLAVLTNLERSEEAVRANLHAVQSECKEGCEALEREAWAVYRASPSPGESTTNGKGT
jgi:hypothetical protein